MPDTPFGFALPGGLPDPNDPAQVQRLLGQIQQLMASGGQGPVNWDLARQVALSTLTGQGGAGPLGAFGFGLPDPTGAQPPAGSAIDAIGAADDDRADDHRPVGNPGVTAAERTSVDEALRLADLWLEPACALPSGMSTTQAWSRGEWIGHTLPIWRKLCDPVAGRMVAAMSDLVPEEMRAELGPMQSMVSSLGGALFGGQLGQALGSLAAEVLSAGDIGLPLGPAGAAALVPANIHEYGRDLSIEPEELYLYVALREAAHQRLFGHVPWLRAHVLGAVETYANGITVNREAIEEAVGRIDPANPETMQDLAIEGIFTPADSPAQQAALVRLETALALVEGWVCHVVDAAAGHRLPSVSALGEMFRRRRAAGGPAEQTFAALVGLELRPRRLREAAALWAAVTEHRGIAGRDALWGHPDLLPGGDDFAEPARFAQATTEFGSVDDVLRAAPGADSPDGTGPGAGTPDEPTD